MAQRPLTDIELAVLDFEAELPSYGGRKDHEIRQRLDMSATAYYQILNRLIESEAALAHNPQLINRLRRIKHGNDRKLRD